MIEGANVSRTARGGAAALRAALAAEGGTIAGVLTELPAEGQELDRPGPAQLAATGPRAAGRERDYELLVEMILEGSLLHYGRPRVVAAGDRDLALLLGDQLYALGLTRLAAIGDLHAVDELADVISLLAQVHAARDGELADAIWEAGAVAVGWGATEAHRAAKSLVRAEDGGAAAALRAVARSAAG